MTTLAAAVARQIMRLVAPVAALVMVSCLCPAHAAAVADNRAPFDPPLQTQRASLGPSPNSPGQNSEVRCYTYQGFMVKEVDRAEVGDDQISVLPLHPPTERPPCRLANRPGEKVVPDATWSGYFLGVRGNYLFLSAADGVNSGMGFAVFRADDTTRLLFQDLTQLVHDHAHIRSISIDGDRLHLSYTRLYAAPCSVPAAGAACWTRIVAETHVPATPEPDCAAGYLRAKQDLAAGRCEAQSHGGDAACLRKEMQGLADEDSSPSVIGYDVDVVLQPTGPQMTPARPASSCWPAD